MGWLSKSLNSSIGKKIIMALTGLSLILFLTVHFINNMFLFFGKEGFEISVAFEADPERCKTVRAGVPVLPAEGSEGMSGALGPAVPPAGRAQPELSAGLSFPVIPGRWWMSK